jgi:shikimate kinase
VHRVIHLVEPTRAGALSKTQHNAALVQALFGQFCAALSHASAAKGAVHCPADFGISYTGTFYDGSRTLAKFIYGATGCQIVSLTADGKTRTAIVLGPAAAAAPKLRDDMAAVLEVPRLAIAQPASGSGQAGSNK